MIRVLIGGLLIGGLLIVQTITNQQSLNPIRNRQSQSTIGNQQSVSRQSAVGSRQSVRGYNHTRSNRSRFITLSHAATKSRTNFLSESAHA